MDIRILHIDDEPDILEAASQILNGSAIGDHRLVMAHSCGFEEGMIELETNDYDLVILDLCTGQASPASEKIGTEVFEKIKQKVFLPIVFFTGLPDYVTQLKSDIVKVAGKADGYENLIGEIQHLVQGGLIELKKDVNGIVKDGLRSFFWEFVHPNARIIADLTSDQVSLKYLLLRRLGKQISTQSARTASMDASFNPENCHPMEFYIYPPMTGEFETGDLIREKGTDNYSVLLTPSCDLVVRNGGNRSAEKILIVHSKDFRTLPQFIKFKELQHKQLALKTEEKDLPAEEGRQMGNLELEIKKWMRPKKNERYFFLPKTSFCPPLLLDFEQKASISYEQLEENYDVVATLDDPISLAVLAGYARYYSRVGYQDLDADYAFLQII
jgi:CheY-like chemotaxis protein